MALKDLFNSSGKLLSSTSLEETGNEIESAGFIQKSIEDKNKFVPLSIFVQFPFWKWAMLPLLPTIYKSLLLLPQSLFI